MAEARPRGTQKAAKGRKKRAVEPRSRGLTAPSLVAGSPPAAVAQLANAIAEDGGVVIGTFCYQERGRFSGGAYHPVVRRVEAFLSAPLTAALEKRAERAAELLALDDAVNAAIVALKDRGFQSPYLRAFVVARINPLRWKRGASGEFDEVIGKMRSAAERFDAAKIKAAEVGRAAGPPEE